MRILIRALICLTVSASAVSAQGKWKEIGKTPTGSSVFVDPSSVKTVNGIVTARLRVKFNPPVDVKKGVKWYASRHIAMFDCAKSRIATKETVYYGDAAESKVVEKHTIGQPGYGPAIGGPTELALNYFCKKN